MRRAIGGELAEVGGCAGEPQCNRAAKRESEHAQSLRGDMLLEAGIGHHGVECALDLKRAAEKAGLAVEWRDDDEPLPGTA